VAGLDWIGFGSCLYLLIAGFWRRGLGFRELAIGDLHGRFFGGYFLGTKAWIQDREKVTGVSFLHIFIHESQYLLFLPQRISIYPVTQDSLPPLCLFEKSEEIYPSTFSYCNSCLSFRMLPSFADLPSHQMKYYRGSAFFAWANRSMKSNHHLTYFLPCIPYSLSLSFAHAFPSLLELP